MRFYAVSENKKQKLKTTLVTSLWEASDKEINKYLGKFRTNGPRPKLGNEMLVLWVLVKGIYIYILS